MKKVLSLALSLMVVLSLFAFTACGKDEGTTFTVGFDAEFPPYGYLDQTSGEYKGFDLDLAREVCERRGWTFQAQPIDWDSKDAELKTGAIDCIWNGFTINCREDDYTWSKPYIDNSQVVVVKADSNITKLSDLAGKNVAVQTDSSAQSVLEDEEKQKALADTFKTLDVQKDYNTCFLNLQSGVVDAIAMDIGVAKYQLSQRESGEYVILDEKLATEQYGIGFKLGNEELRDQVQETLDEIIADGTFEKLAEEYGIDSNSLILE